MDNQVITMYVSNFNISETFKDVSNTLQNFTLIGTTDFEIAPHPRRLVKDVGTKRLGKGRVSTVMLCTRKWRF